MNKRRNSLIYGAYLKGTGRFRGVAGCAVIIVVAAMVMSSCAFRETTKAPDVIYQGNVQKTEEAPNAGSIKMINGYEYIYAKNRRYLTAYYEPEYVWIRKDLYSPSLFESLAQSHAQSDKEYQDLKKRIDLLEAELNKTNKK
jgi:hypothetical protein